MAETENQPKEEASDELSLENPDSSQQTANGASEIVDASTPSSGPGTDNASAPDNKNTKKPGGLKKLTHRFSIYLIMFGFIIIMAIIVVVITFTQKSHTATNSNVKTEGISQSTLQQLANSDATVGTTQSVLNVESSAVFAGQVLLKQDLEVAGNLQVGGTVALNDLAVSGTSQLGQATVNKDLSVAGNTALQGTATIAKSLQVNGNGTFSGPLSAPQITTSNLQLNGDLVLTHHISIGGSTPSRSSGPALGSGGSVSISGSDTAGSVNINTGSSPAAGCFLTITFSTPFNNSPRVEITPVGFAAGGIAYYVNRTTTNFSICDASPPPAGASFGFDYFIVD